MGYYFQEGRPLIETHRWKYHMEKFLAPKWEKLIGFMANNGHISDPSLPQ